MDPVSGKLGPAFDPVDGNAVRERTEAIRALRRRDPVYGVETVGDLFDRLGDGRPGQVGWPFAPEDYPDDHRRDW